MISNNIPITNVHHVAFRCRDAEQTRWFYEDILGLKLAAAMAFDHLSGTDKKIEYMHIFFEMVDGNYIAFFDDEAAEEAGAGEQHDRALHGPPAQHGDVERVRQRDVPAPGPGVRARPEQRLRHRRAEPNGGGRAGGARPRSAFLGGSSRRSRRRAQYRKRCGP